MKNFAQFALAISLLAVSLCLCDAIVAVKIAVASVPDQLAELRTATLGEIDEQANGIRKDVMGQASSAIAIAERQLTGLRAELKQTVNESLAAAIAPIDGIRSDLQPALRNAASITAHVDEASAILLRRDALPAQTLGLIAASKVTAGEMAQTMRTFRDAAPQLVASSEKVAASSASIAESVDKEAKLLTAPRTLRQKIVAWLELIPRIAIKIL
jgi:hypothetical protein